MQILDQTNSLNPYPALKILDPVMPIQLQMEFETTQPIALEQVWQRLSVTQQHSVRQALVKLCRQLLTDQLQTEVAVEQSELP